MENHEINNLLVSHTNEMIETIRTKYSTRCILERITYKVTNK